MASGRYATKPFFHRRGAKCSVCRHTGIYSTNASKGLRVRDQKCERCGSLLGKLACSRAAPDIRAQAAVARLARKMAWPFVTP
jgi:hypothetical protein